MIVYLAGPMSGIEGYNRDAFAKAEKELRKLGYKVINPGVLPTDLPKKAYMPICLAMIEAADVVAFLEGSEGSDGAMLEKRYVSYQGKDFASVDWLLGISDDD